MTLTIQVPDRTLASEADRALRFALTRFAGAIARIRLRLVDENGPRGGVDQRCSVRVSLLRGGFVQVTGVGSDAREVMHQVAERVARALARRLARDRDD